MTNNLDKKVVEHNDLITSIAKMDRVPLKIFELAVAQIDVENPPENNQVFINKEQLYTFFNAEESDTNKNHRFKEALYKMVEGAFFNVRKLKKGNNFTYEVIAPITYVSWADNVNEVTIEFSRHIMPYLVDLKSNFTMYNIGDLTKLDSKYSIIVYKMLTMNYNQFENYRFKNTRTEKQLEELKNPIVTIEELKLLTDTTEKYKRFQNFETRVLKFALDEINANTSLNVRYEKIKKGRSIHAIKFFIDKKFVAPSTEYKQEDKAYIEQKQADLSIYPKAVASNYTQLLLQAEILGATDLSDMDLICSLGAKLYPLYDELASYTDVRNHIVYVKDHMDAYSKENLAKYLIIAGETYLKRCKKEKTKIEDAPGVEVPLNSWI